MYTVKMTKTEPLSHNYEPLFCTLSALIFYRVAAILIHTFILLALCVSLYFLLIGVLSNIII